MKIKAYFSTIIALFFLFFSSQIVFSKENVITIHVPQTVISETLKKVLPLTLDNTSPQLEGRVTIVDISAIKIADNSVFSHIHLKGKDLNLITKMANQDIRLKLGSAELDFDCEAKLRFDKKTKKLYITPIAQGLEGEQDLQKGEVGNAMLLLLNGKEFPVDMQQLKPILAETATKTVSIETEIVEVKAVKGALQLFLTPKVSTTAKK